MPDVNGQMFLSDFRTELKNRGFDGFADSELNTLINRGYFYVARKFPWYWREDDVTLAFPASSSLAVGDLSASTPGLKNVRAVFMKNIPSTGVITRLDALDEDEFYNTWWQEYESGVTGIPQKYFIDKQVMWLLPKVGASYSGSLEIHYHKRPQALSSDSSISIMPVDLDEVILLAALVRCHKRSQEPGLATVAQIDLEEAFDDLRDLEGTRYEDLQERVRPDDTWA